MKTNKLNIGILLIIASLLSFNLCFAGEFDEYKNELHTNRLAIKDNAIWIVSSKGLVKYDKTTHALTSASAELGVSSEIEYLSIATAPDNSLWFASEEMGIQKYNGQLRDYCAIGNIRAYFGFFYAFAFDSQGRVFSGEIDNIMYVDNLIPIIDEYPWCKQFFSLADGGLPACAGRPVMDMAFDSQDNLWILSDNHNAYYDDGECGFATLVKKNKVGIDNALSEIHVFPHKLIYPEPILEFDEIYSTSLVIDKEDNIWFTSEEGIHYYNQVTDKDSLINNSTHSAIPNEHFYINEKDEEGSLWFSSSTKLMKYNGADFTTYTCTDYQDARAILCDEDIVWILLKNDKLLKFQNNEFETIDLSPAVTGIKENTAEISNTKVYISNGMLYVKSIEDIIVINIYDSLGREIIPLNWRGDGGETQIQLPSALKGVLLVKVNNEVVKVICE